MNASLNETDSRQTFIRVEPPSPSHGTATALPLPVSTNMSTSPSSSSSFGLNPIPSFLQTSSGKQVCICTPSEQITPSPPPLYTPTSSTYSSRTRAALRISESPLFTDYCQQESSSSSDTTTPFEQDSNHINNESHEPVQMSGRKRRKSTKYQGKKEFQDAVDEHITPMTYTKEFIRNRMYSLEGICKFNKVNYQTILQAVPKESVITSSTPPNSFGPRWNNLVAFLGKCVLNMVSICSNEYSKNYLLRGILKFISNRLEENHQPNHTYYEELKEHEKVADVLATLYKRSPKESIQKRLLRAVLVQYSPDVLRKLDIKHGIGLYDNEKLKSLGRADYSVMMNGGILQTGGGHSCNVKGNG